MYKYKERQDEVLQILPDKIDDFYLAGGTALACFYFNHRESVDLDFFTKDYAPERVEAIIEELKKCLKKKITLTFQVLTDGKARIMIYEIEFNKTEHLKIDFVEDFFDIHKPFKKVEGINILSLEDIYLRKIFAIAEIIPKLDITGRKQFIGGRQEAKDFFDLYYLSHTFMNLSQFAVRYLNAAFKESLVVWCRTYDCLDIKLGLKDLITDKEIDYQQMERHFKKEIDKLLKEELKDL